MKDPNEYAIRLVKKFYPVIRKYNPYERHIEENYADKIAKQCALIDVQNTIDALVYASSEYDGYGKILYKEIEHFNQVKEEINKL
jgi:hypothetical protein